jgi:hypothetical protein
MDELAGRELQQARMAEIHRRWPRYGWDYLGRSRWDSWSAEPFLGLGITGALIAALYFEFTLLTGKAEPWFAALSDLGLHPTGRAVILLLTGVNAWMMDRWLASRTRGNRSISAWLRLLRPLTAGVPVFGLASVPAWRWIVKSRPAWAFHRALPRASAICLPTVPEPSLSTLRFSRVEIWARTHSQNMPELMAWIIGCQLAPFLGGLSWLAGNGLLDASRRMTLQTACVVLHLLAAFFGVWFVRSKLSSRAFPWLLLVPGLGLLSVLLLDAAALSWLVGRMTDWRLGPDLPASRHEILIFLLPALPGTLLTAACLVAQWTGRCAALRDMGRHQYGPFLALVPVVAMSGLLIGSLQARGSTPEVGLCLYAIALSGVLLQVLSMPLSVLSHSPVPSEAGALLWYLLWAELIVLSAFLIYQPATPLARALEMALLAAPVWSLGLFLALGGWLMRPFTFRHLTDRRLPRRERAILAGVAFTAALPLGGLFIPLWIYAHHRLWPGMERSWADARP